MFSKLNNTWKALIFIALLLLAVIVVFTNKSNSSISRNRTFKSDLIDFDSSKVTSITIYPAMNNEIITLRRNTEGWKVKTDNGEYNADPGQVKNMMNSILALKAKRIAANDRSKWEDYEVTDSTATRVQIQTGNKILADIYLGKFSYQQPSSAGQNPYMQQQVIMTSYVRFADKKNVYAVDGIISMSFNRAANDFRNKTVINSNKENWDNLSFHTPDGNFDLQNEEGRWMIDGLVADSSTVVNYLNNLARLNSEYFVDETVTNETEPSFSLNIQRQNTANSIKLDAYKADTAILYAITSSMNSGTWFNGKQSDLFEKIFKEKEYFLDD